MKLAGNGLKTNKIDSMNILLQHKSATQRKMNRIPIAGNTRNKNVSQVREMT